MTEKKKSKKKKILIGIAILLILLIVGVGGYYAYAVMNPAEPEITMETGMDCSETGLCNKNCALKCPGGLKRLPCMRHCSARCVKQACPSGVEPFDDLMACIEGECLLKCMNGPTPTCEKCYNAKCVDLVKACDVQKCNNQD
ncbi:MAG: hypothetical protein PF689_06315 [Deltaproteobacteria bacterium]|jgi:hypothetical protein|nr:hypothetical protein [Deltaproteobacteria bacterium]